MLAGKLPFKVENRSKNLAKLHACILKGFEIPPFLSPGKNKKKHRKFYIKKKNKKLVFNENILTQNRLPRLVVSTSRPIAS